MISEIISALQCLECNSSVNVIVFRSNVPKIFCAGADIKGFIKINYEEGILNELFTALEDAFRNMKKPIMAVVNGKALGGGFELALLCDMILCSENAYFGLPQITLGLIPGMGGTQRLTRIIGEKMAMRYILSGQGFSGVEASNNKVAQLVSADKLQNQAIRLAKVIASKSLTTAVIAKRSIKAAQQTTLQHGLNYEKAVFYPLLSQKLLKKE